VIGSRIVNRVPVLHRVYSHIEKSTPSPIMRLNRIAPHSSVENKVA
jgi:hypothetical protein